MVNRTRTVGESFSKPRMRTASLIQDGTNGQYVRIDGKWYLLTFISDGTKNELVDHRLPQIDYLRDLVVSHRDTAIHLRQSVTDDTTEFQHIIIAHHVSIAHFLSDAFYLLQKGSLAGSMVLLRPVVEIMIEIQYLRRYPSEVGDYYCKVEKHNEQTRKEGKPIERTRRNLRFETIQNLIKTLENCGNPSEIEERLINQWKLLSAVASHVTPELLDIAQVRQDWAWENLLGELEKVTWDAIEQMHDADKALGHIIDQAQELKYRERLRNLVSYGTSTSPLD